MLHRTLYHFHFSESDAVVILSAARVFLFSMDHGDYIHHTYTRAHIDQHGYIIKSIQQSRYTREELHTGAVHKSAVARIPYNCRSALNPYLISRV